MTRVLVCLAALAAAGVASARPVVTFDEVELGTLIDGQTIRGASFSWFANQPEPDGGKASGPFVSFGPGELTYVSDPSLIFLTGEGTLFVQFPEPINFFSFGFAIDTFDFVEGAVDVSVLTRDGFRSGYSFDAEPLVSFAEGEAAVETPFFFDAIAVTFPFYETSNGPRGGDQAAWAFDNLRWGGDTPVIPLPTASGLGFAGLALLGLRRRR